jgi:hypothetical protein
MLTLALPLALTVSLFATPPLFSDADWSRVRRIEPGQEISLTAAHAPPVQRLVVSANDSEITILRLPDPALPPAVTRALRDTAHARPEHFNAIARGETFIVGNVKMSSAGIFLSDRRVADLDHVVETIARPAVNEISIRRQGRGFWGHLGLLGGYFVGAMAGGYGSAAACQVVAGRQRCDSGAFLTGMVVGGIAGGAYGFHAARRETDEVVYRVP